MKGEGKQPEISVVMSVYNQKNPDYLKESISSVLKQTFQNFEFIIYSDGSDTEVLLQLKQYANQDSRIVLMRDPQNHGLAYSLNVCIRHARGKYIARMDDDDECAPNRLGLQYKYMEQHPDIPFVGSNAALMDEGGVWGSRKMAEYPGKLEFLKYSPYIHPSVMFRKSVLEQTGGYCAGKGTSRCEDYELFLRLLEQGQEGYNLQEELLFYREERASYEKRTLSSRIDEMKLRGRRFKELGWLFPFGWAYVLRPVAAAAVPSALLYRIKRLQYKN